MLDPREIKKSFPLFENAHSDFAYLDSTASTQTPRVVLDAMREYYEHYRANIHRGLYEQSARATQSYEDARAVLAKFIGADPEEVIFTSGATSASNMLVAMFEHSGVLSEGDEIVTSVMEHHSMLIPLQQLAKRRKMTLKYIEVTKDGELDVVSISKLVNKKTRILAVTAASNVLGTINDLSPLQDLAEANDAFFVVDATQAVGHIPFDVKKINCDFAFFSGHKMCGPTGIGVLYGKKELLEKLEPGFYGGNMIREVRRDDALWAGLPEKFEAGTPNIAGAIGLGTATQFIDSIGLDEIHNHIQKVTAYALQELGKLDSVKLVTEKNISKNVGVMSFTIKDIHSHDVAQVLAERHIAIRAGHHCAMPLAQSLGVASLNRASFYMYTSNEDVDRLVEGIRAVEKLFAPSQEAVPTA